MQQPSPAQPVRRPLRVALLVDSPTLPRWCHDVVRDIQASGFAEVVLVVENAATAAAPPAPARSRLGRLWANRQHLLYALYSKLDDRRFRAEPDPFAERSIEPLVRDCAMMRVQPRATRFSDYFEDADVETIRAHDLDVAIRLGFRILRGRALEIARHGVWSYHHGDNLVNRGGPPGFWEVMEGNPVTGSVLQVLTDELDAGRVIYRSYAATDRRSVNANRANYYWKSAAFVLRKLRDLYCEGPAALADGAPQDEMPAYSNRLYVAPTNRELTPLLARRLGRSVAARAAGIVRFEQWVLAFGLRKGVSADNEVPDGTLYRFRTLLPPKDRFWADPFPVRRGDRYYIFLEELPYATGRGHISVIEMDETGQASAPVTVLARPHHLSYPFVFEWNGAHYMVPESYDTRSVDLYRAVDFPHRWELERTLLSDVLAVDATLAEVDGRWWMFVNMAPLDGVSASDELFIYHAESPLGPWHPHRRNPVKSDVRSARPAGRPFWYRGQLYRPAQDCSVSYGHAIVLNRVRRLDLEHYDEDPVARIDAKWRPGLTGTHTLNAAGGLTVVDAKLLRPRYG